MQIAFIFDSATEHPNTYLPWLYVPACSNVLLPTSAGLPQGISIIARINHKIPIENFYSRSPGLCAQMTIIITLGALLVAEDQILEHFIELHVIAGCITHGVSLRISVRSKECVYFYYGENTRDFPIAL
jgi:hypothetical protein